jgi:hypothetical protein
MNEASMFEKNSPDCDCYEQDAEGGLYAKVQPDDSESKL